MTRRNVLISVGIIIVAVAATAILLPSLTGNSDKPAVTPQPTTSPTTPASPAANASPTASANWSTAEVSLASRLQSGTAMVKAIRIGAHPEAGYDRISIDFQGQSPAVRARYVNQVIQDGSGAQMTLPGAAYLQLTFDPAAAHDEAGNPAAGVPRGVQAIGFAGLKSYAMNGDFEGIVSIALGQSSQAGFKVNRVERGDITTIYIDVPRP